VGGCRDSMIVLSQWFNKGSCVSVKNAMNSRIYSMIVIAQFVTEVGQLSVIDGCE
jgi:hypothetical protein